ncbi:MAG: 50S ribosomal protein L4 [Candidatus Hepatoplasma scabrum]|nr:MAG: 50S ribosomal protein L4 [Candidatus Hepatoplasma sp.]
MATIDVLNVLGKKVDTLELAEEVFDITPHEQAMYDLILVERASLRQGTHSTKTRSDVSGGGRKPWKQKGTGRARQGSIRSPQWRGGGVVFGPKAEKNYTLKINKKVKKLALKSGWSQLLKENKIIVVDNLDFKTPSTKDFKIMLKNLAIEKEKVLFVIPSVEKNEQKNAYLSGRNIKNISVNLNTNVMLNKLLKATKILLTKDAIKSVEKGLMNEKT